MLEDLKTLTDALVGLENGALYALFAFLFYKLSTYFGTGAILVILLKPLVTGVAQWLAEKKEPVNRYTVKLHDQTISVDATDKILQHTLERAITQQNAEWRRRADEAGATKSANSRFLHEEGADILARALDQYIADWTLKQGESE